ncbi:MAG: hypothetical protein IK115_07585 [Lachnospiraceae bacterium]|nr:hypothetical protein [Lachnospiraceae bacterium]
MDGQFGNMNFPSGDNGVGRTLAAPNAAAMPAGTADSIGRTTAAASGMPGIPGDPASAAAIMPGAMPMPGQTPVPGQMPMPGQAPIQGQMPVPGQPPIQGQVPVPGQMPAPNGMPFPAAGAMPGMMPNAAWPQPEEKKKVNAGVVVLIVTLFLLLIAGGVVAFLIFGPKKEITLSKSSLHLEVDETGDVKVENYDSDLSGIHLDYTVEDTDIARISKEFYDGFYVEGISEGQTTITVSGRGCESVVIKVKVTE